MFIYTTGVQFADGSIQKATLPPRAILIWWGSLANIPAGFQLCDGTNGTLDLRDKFIVGAGDTYETGDTGGSNSVTLGVDHIPPHAHDYSGSMAPAGGHTHTLTFGSAGAHNHGPNTLTGAPPVVRSASPGTGGVTMGSGGSMNAAGNHSHSVSVSEVSSHTHSVSSMFTPAGSSQSHENRPPYYALAFIMEPTI